MKWVVIPLALCIATIIITVLYTLQVVLVFSLWTLWNFKFPSREVVFCYQKKWPENSDYIYAYYRTPYHYIWGYPPYKHENR